MSSRNENTGVSSSFPSFTCPMCPYTSTNPESLQVHVNKIHLDDSHICPLCSQQFDNPTLLVEHFTANHRESHQPKSKIAKHPNKSPILVICPVCDKTGWSEAQLPTHVESHFTSTLTTGTGTINYEPAGPSNQAPLHSPSSSTAGKSNFVTSGQGPASSNEDKQKINGGAAEEAKDEVIKMKILLR